MHAARRLVTTLSLVLAAAAVPAAAEEPPVPAPAPAPAKQEPPAPAPAPEPAKDESAAGKEKKVLRFLELSRWAESVMEGMEAAFAQQVKLGVLPKSFAKHFRKAADMEALKKAAIGVFMEVYDEPTLDGLIAFLQTDAGKKYAESSLKLVGVLQDKITPWAMETAQKTMESMAEGTDDEEDEGNPLVANLKDAKRSSNETAAIAILRNLASCQAQIQTSGKIDCDTDGIGEYGTFLEMTGSAGVRKGIVRSKEGPLASGPSDFSEQGSKIDPPILSPSLAGVDADGVVRRSGYCFRICLPDSAKAAGFVHETGPRDKPGLAGGTGKVGTDLAETTWCAYAWPDQLGESGTRAFFVNQSGDLLQSANGKAKWDGVKAPPPDTAFLGAGMTSPAAVGTLGRDGEVWKLTN